MNTSYIFCQLVSFSPKRVFDGIKRHEGVKRVKHFNYWEKLLVIRFGQLADCDRFREVAAIINVIKRKSDYLGFDIENIKLSNMFYENANRNYKIFEKFTYYMISLAQSNRVSKPFALNENIYVFDSTMMDLRINLFEWTYFKKAKNGIKVHTLFDMVTQIPTYVYTTRARLHDVKAIDEVSYESNVFHIFNKEY